MSDNETLRQQFQQLQEQQAKKLARRKQKKEEKTQESLNKSMNNEAFGVNDDLDLKLADPPPAGGSYISEELVDHLNDQIRELKDENGRLYKLLSERDFEIRQLKKKQTEDRAVIGGGGVASEQAATKIVELSKKVRELTAEAESEKTKTKLIAKKCQELQHKLSVAEANATSTPRSAKIIFTNEEDGRTYTEADFKSLQDKLKQTESKTSEFRNQCTTLRNDLKIAQKVITSEVGEGVTIQSLSNTNGNWRGRAQQIIALQRKVTDLKGQLDQQQARSKTGDLESEFMGMTSLRKTTDDKQRETLKKMEKERRDIQEKAEREFKALEEDHSVMKQKFDAAKARNKVLSNEVKSLKQQMQRLLDKGQHDDELIEALMKQQSKLKAMMDDSTKQHKDSSDQVHQKVQHLAAKMQQDTNVTEQLRAIVAEKESKVKALEDEIRMMRQMNIQKSQVDTVNTMFERVASRNLPSRSGTVVITASQSPVHSPTPPSRLSMRSISRQSADGDVIDRPSSRWGSQPVGRPASTGSAVDKQATNELNAQVQEFKSLAGAAEVERDKLMELVQVLQQRSDESSQKAIDATSELTTQKRKVVQLEKQLGKVQLEQSQQNPKSGMKKNRGRATVQSMIDENGLGKENSFDSNNIEEVETRLAIQLDENEALKAALETTLQSKEEDLKLYNEMLDQTKQVFLQGLRQYRQGSAH